MPNGTFSTGIENILDMITIIAIIGLLVTVTSNLVEAKTVGQVLDEIRRAINQSGVSRYAISKATGIDQGQLSKLMAGEVGLSMSNLQKLLDFLKLEIVICPKRRRKGK